MTSAAVERLTSKAASSGVVPFQRTTEGNTNNAVLPSELIRQLMASDPFLKEVKSVVEGHVFEIVSRWLALDTQRGDNPFDAIYLSELMPDEISKPWIDRIRAHANIRDLSDALNFNDGLDD